MTTTHLFVELLVIGIGAFLALLLGIAAVFGGSPEMFSGFMNVRALIPVLATVYVLGILVDRFADRAFDSWDMKLRRSVFGEEDSAYYEARRTLVMDAENLWRDLHYGRSRLRICRGWVFNSVLLMGGLWAFRYSDKATPVIPAQEFWVALGSLALLGVGCTWCWYRLIRTEYKKTQRIANWLETRTVDTSRVQWFMEAVFRTIETERQRIQGRSPAESSIDKVAGGGEAHG